MVETLDHQQQIHIFLIGPDYHSGKRKVKTAIKRYQLEDIIHIIDMSSYSPNRAPLISADLQITLSRCDAPLRTVREGLYYGIPQIVTEATQLADIVKSSDSGYVIAMDCDQNMQNQLANILLSIADNPKILTTKKINTTLAKKMLAAEVFGQKLADFYLQVIQN